ncbi:hypothetical protein ALC62_13718 [Cyphomyrmex costatus]|uniref:Uncharacterized protein n=1 Tax=Cyphomyrmex costatus TaxID=456900 RepID=A0A195C611_9HYME|nr:hypothetical protein ALC62_13718 [Cyphomyrmex costatus]
MDAADYSGIQFFHRDAVIAVFVGTRHLVCESERQGTVQTELFEIMTGQDITRNLLNVKPFHFKVLESRSENILR